MWYTAHMNSFGTFLEELNRADPIMLAQKLEAKFSELEAKIAQQDRTIIGLQNELIRAGRFTHEDSQKQLEGVQVLLTRAGEYKGRKPRTKRG